MIKQYLIRMATFLIILGLFLTPVTGLFTAHAAGNVNFEGQIGGESYAVDWVGSMAYVGVGPRLVVINASNPAKPVLMGQSAPLPDTIQGLRVFQGLAYVVTGDSGLHILNPNLSSVPLLGQYDTPGFARDVDLILGPGARPYAFVADGANGVVALDVSNASSPTQHSSYQAAGGGSAESVSVDLVGEEHVYIAYGDQGLHVWRPFHQPSADVYSTAAGNDLEDVYALLDYVYVADGGYGLRIFKWVETPDEGLQEVGSYPISWSYVEGITVNQGASYAYLVGGGHYNGGLTAIDVTKKSAPAYAGFAELPGYAYKVVLDAGFKNAFVADGAFGLRVIDIQNLSGMGHKASVAGVGQPKDVALSGAYAYLADGEAGLKIVDTTDPTAPALVRSYWPPHVTDQLNFTGVAVSGAHVFMTEDKIGLRIFDVSDLNNPATPSQVGSVALTGRVNDVAVDGSYAYVANDAEGLQVIDVSSPASPSAVGSYAAAAGEAYDVAAAGGYAYLAYGASGLKVVDVSTPTAPVEVASLTGGIGFAEGVALFGSTLYLADSSSGLHVIDVSTPTNPQKLGSIVTPGGPANVSPAGKYYALVADYDQGLRVIDVSDPTTPREIGAYDTAGLAVGVAHGGYAFVADTDGGFWTLNALGTDLQVQNSDGRESVGQGEVVTYTITVSNLGSYHADGVVISDTFPAGLTNVSWSCTASLNSDCPASGSGDINATVSVLSGGTVTFLASGSVSTTVGAVLQNTAALIAPPGVDNETANNSATDTTATLNTDLTLTKTAHPQTVVPGQSVTYTLLVANTGPAAVPGATVWDTLPAHLINAQWSCTPSLGGVCPSPASGSGDIDAVVDLSAAIGSVTFVVSGLVDPAATGSLVNTATVQLPAGIYDTNLADNTAVETIGLTPEADVQLSQTRQSSDTPGTPVTYTIVLTNVGPSITGLTVSDTFPAEVTQVAWICRAVGGSSCPASGSGDINASVGLLVNGMVTFEAVGTLAANAGGAITNTAAALLPANVTDTNLANNVANDVLLIGGQEADLRVSKTDGSDSTVPGAPVVYTIVAANDGPSSVTGAHVGDLLPAALTNASWTCGASPGSSCPAGGSGDIDVLVDLAAGGMVTFTLTADVDPAAVGALSNAATITAPAGVNDPDLNNNSAADTDTLDPSADLILTQSYTGGGVPGTAVSYVISVANNGPSDVTGAQVSDTFPTALTGVSWTCSAAAGASCPSGGSGHIAVAVDLTAGSGLTFTAQATLKPAASGAVDNTAAVSLPAGVTNLDPGNDAVTRSFTAGTPTADLAISQQRSGGAEAGQSISYTIIITNNGPSDVSGAVVTDDLPDEIENLTWSCVASSAASSCAAASGSGDINLTVNLAAGDRITLIAAGTVAQTAGGSLVNVASVSAPAGVIDPVTGNNTASSLVSLPATFDLMVTGEITPTVIHPGQVITYEISVTNNGPGAAQNVQLIDTLPARAEFVSASVEEGEISQVVTACTRTGRTVTCNIDKIGNGATAVVNIVVKASPEFEEMTNEIFVLGNGGDETISINNRATVQVTVEPYTYHFPIIFKSNRLSGAGD